jgi:glycerophosphoryl diester phosphodiesterase
VKKPKVIAHRGGREWAPENTLAAFGKSLEFGAAGIELDVQRCATGELVVIHDEDLARTTNGVGLIRDCSLGELRRLSAGTWFDKQFQTERIPLLEEVLELVCGKMIINIELKNAPIDYPDIEDDLLNVIDGYDRPETLIISSFDHKLLASVHEKAPKLNIAILGAAVFLNLGELATRLGATYFHPAFDCVRADVMTDARAAGLEVNVWTCNSQQEWRRAVKMEVDGIVTDDPEGLTEYLEKISSGAGLPL